MSYKIQGEDLILANSMIHYTFAPRLSSYLACLLIVSGIDIHTYVLLK